MQNMSEKELTAVQEQLEQEQNLVKKYKLYAQQTTDSQLKTKCEHIATQHQRHFDTLAGNLK